MEVLCQKPESGATASSPRPRLPGQPGCHPTVKGGELEPRGRPRRGQGEERSAPPFPPTGLLSGLGARGRPVWRAAPRRDWMGQRPDGTEAGANLEAEATSFLSREALELRVQGREAWTLTVLGQGGNKGDRGQITSPRSLPGPTLEQNNTRFRPCWASKCFTQTIQHKHLQTSLHKIQKSGLAETFAADS